MNAIEHKQVFWVLLLVRVRLRLRLLFLPITTTTTYILRIDSNLADNFLTRISHHNFGNVCSIHGFSHNRNRNRNNNATGTTMTMDIYMVSDIDADMNELTKCCYNFESFSVTFDHDVLCSQPTLSDKMYANRQFTVTRFESSQRKQKNILINLRK